jgi:hypothetical protein
VSAEHPGGGFGTVFHPEPDPVPPGNGGPVRIGQLRPLPRRRRPAMVALGVALVGAGVLGGAALFQRVNHQVPVLVVSTAVPAGAVVTSADLSTVSVAAGPGVQLVPARQEGQVVGLVAASNLRPGALLSATDLTRSLPPAAGQMLVPVAFKPSQLPASGLAAGDHVVVVWAPGASSSAASAATTGRDYEAVVEDVASAPDQDGFQVVDLLVPAASGPGLAREAASGNVVLTVLSRKP